MQDIFTDQIAVPSWIVLRTLERLIYMISLQWKSGILWVLRVLEVISKKNSPVLNYGWSTTQILRENHEPFPFLNISSRLKNFL